jgi:hypothetical protein
MGNLFEQKKFWREKNQLSKNLLPVSFQVLVLKIKTSKKLFVDFGYGMVNFGRKYLGFCSDFVQHILTHSNGFVVSFSMIYLL